MEIEEEAIEAVARLMDTPMTEEADSEAEDVLSTLMTDVPLSLQKIRTVTIPTVRKTAQLASLMRLPSLILRTMPN
jgi:hypothetical protein